MSIERTLRVSFRTFGCKLNQAETESIARDFASAGAIVVAAGRNADLIVFNTCTVTSKAEQKARREMRLALRLNPEAVALVTGCYAELEPEALAALAPRCVVVPGSRKGALGGMAAGLVDARQEGLDLLDETRRLAAIAAGKTPDPFAFVPGEARFHARVQLKVQDGCDNSCSYCRVCIARGPSLSLEPGQILSRATALAELGVPEIVLTGVNLSQYRSGGLDFSGLLTALVDGTRGVAFRVSSWEPDRVDASFVRAFALDRVRPHLHLSVQAGSDSVLGTMGRHYGRDQVLRAAEAVRAVRDDPFIGVDMILGFPGESDADFALSLDLLERLEPAWIHAFTFSPRPGTRAYSMKNRVPERVAVERAAIVQELALRGKAAFASRRLGRLLEAVVESVPGPDESVPGPDVPATGPAAGGSVSATSATSADYLKLALRGAPAGFRGSCLCRVSTAAPPGLSENGPDLLADFVSTF